MNKIESRHRLIRSLIMEKRVHTQQELQELLEANGVIVTQSTLSRDMKTLNLVKVTENDKSYYVINSIAPSRWRKDCASIWKMPSSCSAPFSIKSS